MSAFLLLPLLAKENVPFRRDVVRMECADTKEDVSLN